MTDAASKACIDSIFLVLPNDLELLFHKVYVLVTVGYFIEKLY